MKKANLIYTIVGAGIMVGSFQNCSATPDFSQDLSSSSSSLGTGGSSLNSQLTSLLCAAGSSSNSLQYYPTNCLNNSGLPSNAIGFQSNNNYQIAKAGGASAFTLNANNSVSGTSAPAMLYIEVATYAAPDSIVITSVGRDGKTVQLLNICDIATYTGGDPTNGVRRPYSDTILQFEVLLPAGSKQINFDFSGAKTPTYLGVWNLNEFSQSLAQTNPFATNLPKQTGQFRVQSGPPATYNDNADPGQPSACYN